MVLRASPGAPIVTADTTTSDVNGQPVNLAADGLDQSYSYDAFGNFQQSGNFNFLQAYTSANHLVGWNYDASGNMLSDAYSNVYTYDAEGKNTGVRLSSGGSASYTCDANGQRIEKVYGPTVMDTLLFGGSRWRGILAAPGRTSSTARPGCWPRRRAPRLHRPAIASWTTSAR